MSSSISRNILMCVVPTVILLFSVFWLRKKKKIKSNTKIGETSVSTTLGALSSNSSEESVNEAKLISIVDGSTSDLSFTSPIESFVQCDKSIHETEVEKSVKCNNENFHSLSDGLSSLLSNHVQDSSFYSSNTSLNASRKDEQTNEIMEVPYSVSPITELQIENEYKCSLDECISQPLPVDPLHEEGAQISEMKSDCSDSGVIDMSRISNGGDESESLGFTEESLYASDELASPESEAQNAHEIAANDTEAISQSCNSNSVRKSNLIIDLQQKDVRNSSSDSKDLLIAAFKEMMENDEKLSPHIRNLSLQQNSDETDSEMLSKPDLLLQSNITLTEANATVCNNLIDENSETITIKPEKEDTSASSLSSASSCSKDCPILSDSSPDQVQYCEAEMNGNDDNELMMNHQESIQVEVAESTDSTLYDSTLPNSSHSESPATTASEEPEKPGLQLKEMDITEHFNINSNANISIRSWKASEFQQIAVLNSGKIEESLIDYKSVNPNGPYVYEFDLPQELCGRLIGRQGKTVKSIKERSNANVFIKRHPYDEELKIVVVEGNRYDVDNALDIIRRKYPPSQFPTVSLEQTNVISALSVPLPENLPLHLPVGASCDVILSSLVSAGHFFLQQPTHPTYPSLSTLDQCMNSCYSHLNTPLLPTPIEAGVICAAPVLQGWYRAQVLNVSENNSECRLKFVDYGGFSSVLTSSLRQIRSDFMTLPFQATECYLANVKPLNRDMGWTTEARATFEELAQGQILHAVLVDYKEDGCPCVHLHRVQGISNVFINRELVEQGHAIWVDSHWDPH